jgi:hypothetical protein
VSLQRELDALAAETSFAGVVRVDRSADLVVERAYLGVILARSEAEPGEQEQALQVAQIARRERPALLGERLGRRDLAALAEQLGVARPGRDGAVAADTEAARQQLAPELRHPPPHRAVIHPLADPDDGAAQD